jgi:hypothetical protein
VPNAKPKKFSGEWFNTKVECQAKSFPFIMLINAPDIIYTCRPEALAPETFCFSLEE